MAVRIRTGASRCSFIAEMRWTLFAPAGSPSPSSGREINGIWFSELVALKLPTFHLKVVCGSSVEME